MARESYCIEIILLLILFSYLIPVIITNSNQPSMLSDTLQSYQKADINKKGALVVKMPARQIEWVGYAQHGLQEGKTAKRAIYVSLACDNAADAHEFAKETFKTHEDVIQICWNLWNNNHDAFRGLLEIPEKADVTLLPSGTYNPQYKSLSIFPHLKWTKFLEDAEPEPVIKNYAYFLAMDDDKRSSDVAISMTINTVHFNATDVTAGGADVKERKWHVLATTFFNIKKLILSRSELQSNELDKERETQHTRELTEKLRSRKRKVVESPSSTSSKEVSQPQNKKQNVSFKSSK